MQSLLHSSVLERDAKKREKSDQEIVATHESSYQCRIQMKYNSRYSVFSSTNATQKPGRKNGVVVLLKRYMTC